MRLLISALFLSVLSMPAVGDVQVEIFRCTPFGLTVNYFLNLEVYVKTSTAHFLIS